MSIRKSRLLALAAVAASAALALSACSGGSDSTTETSEAASGEVVTLRVGAMIPATEILEFVQDNLAEEAGLNLEITEFSEYTAVNTALDEGSLDANLYQHAPYLANFNSENGTDIVSVGEVYFPPLALYSLELDSLDELEDGSTITLPADPTNQLRSLELLQAAGLIELADDAADVDGVTENPKNLQFELLDAASLPRALEDVPAGIVNLVYALGAGLTGEQQLFHEEQEGSPYVNLLAVNAGDEERPEIQTLYELLTSPETQAFIEEEWGGLVLPAGGN